MINSDEAYLYRPGKKEAHELIFTRFLEIFCIFSTFLLIFMFYYFFGNPNNMCLFWVFESIPIFIFLGMVFIVLVERHLYLYTITDKGFIYPLKFWNLNRKDNFVSFNEITAITFSSGGCRCAMKLQNGKMIEIRTGYGTGWRQSFTFVGTIILLNFAEDPPFDGTIPYLIIINTIIKEWNLNEEAHPNFEYLKNVYSDPVKRKKRDVLFRTQEEMEKLNARFLEYPPDWKERIGK